KCTRLNHSGVFSSATQWEVPAYASFVLFFFFNDTAPTEIYPFSLHDALPISGLLWRALLSAGARPLGDPRSTDDSRAGGRDRKSTRLNSSHPSISYAVFC